MRILLNLNGDGQSYILANRTESYYSKLRSAYLDIRNDLAKDYLFFGFFTLCSATLEYSLNYILTNFCLSYFGMEDYKSHAKSYVSNSFQQKLMTAPSIISSQRLVMGEDNASYKVLCEMIKTRNKILHNKEFLQAVQLPAVDFSKEDYEFQIELEDAEIDSLSKEECLRLGDAIGDFRKFIMIPALENNLDENEMLISK